MGLEDSSWDVTDALCPAALSASLNSAEEDGGVAQQGEDPFSNAARGASRVGFNADVPFLPADDLTELQKIGIAPKL